MVKFGATLKQVIHKHSSLGPKYIDYDNLKGIIKKYKPKYNKPKGTTTAPDNDGEDIPLLAAEGAHWAAATTEFTQELSLQVQRSVFLKDYIPQLTALVDNLLATDPANKKDPKKQDLYADQLVAISKEASAAKTFIETNRLAVKKITKKWNKNAPPAYRLDPDKFLVNMVSEELEQELLAIKPRLVEEAHEIKGQGSRNPLKKRMKTHSSAEVLVLGMFLGVMWCLILALGFQIWVQVGIPDGMRIFEPIYRLVTVMAAVAWSYALMVRVCEKHGINYAYILNYNPVNFLKSVQAAMIAAALTDFLMLVALIHMRMVYEINQNKLGLGTVIRPFITADMSADTAGHIEHALPFVMLLLILVALFNPFRILFYRSRMCFVETMWDIISLPWGVVGFRQFFLGDQLTSLTYGFTDLQYTICLLVTHVFTDGDNLPGLHGIRVSCGDISNHAKYIVSVIPYLWRLIQCVKMYNRTKEAGQHTVSRVHFINSGKYASFVLLQIYGLFWANLGAPRGILVALSFVAEIYATSWDVLMDWGWVHRKKTNIFGRKWVYMAIWAPDVVIRFLFLFTYAQGAIVPHLFEENHLMWIMALTEIGVRRAVWNIFRLENEMTNNLEAYRSIKYIPQPVDELHRVETHHRVKAMSSVPPSRLAFSQPATPPAIDIEAPAVSPRGSYQALDVMGKVAGKLRATLTPTPRKQDTSTSSIGSIGSGDEA
eukprot:TRINITY_DN35404_c0_g2_i1.p1 TRINITY_DN35404_c0_g2~~TRINITY_DN35404_c0_g2_i1.p1  ORF type:complete len:714 (-),score=36.98 TRINITY_DN35404_c0_g2_i1:203-2344(-)